MTKALPSVWNPLALMARHIALMPMMTASLSLSNNVGTPLHGNMRLWLQSCLCLITSHDRNAPLEIANDVLARFDDVYPRLSTYPLVAYVFG